MDMYDIILEKRKGGKLSREEIQFFIDGYTAGEIPDYQAAALLMAIMFQGFDMKETVFLTDAMKRSGDLIDLSRIHGIKVDKHSTGGVGDKTTLVVAPIVSALGVPVAKMSGRGLGFTGGTVDKMESIPGMKTSMETDDFIRQINDIGLAVIGQTGHIAPADKKLYALRDVTATIDHLSLISSSIMSKKLAAGSDAILLDVKCGNGAFMETIADATKLGEMMVEIGNRSGKRTVAAVTDMSQPLGMAVGNSLEVMEAIETLKGKGPADLWELSLKLAGMMLLLGEKVSTPEAGMRMAEEAVTSGKALEQFRRFVSAQGGNADVTKNTGLFPQPSHTLALEAQADGFIYGIDANGIGRASRHTGAGRLVMGEALDLSAGILLKKKRGDRVLKGEPLALVMGTDEAKLQPALEECKRSFHIHDLEPPPVPMIHAFLGI